MTPAQKKAAAMIDQTLLSPSATEEEVRAFCIEAKKYGFASVCLNPVHLKTARSLLLGSKTKLCTVIDFPLGAGGTAAKTYGVSSAIAGGADEVDVVMDLSLAKAHKWRQLRTQLTHIIKTVRRCESNCALAKEKPPVVTKLILETCLLTDEEIVQACIECKSAGFDFVKTSTGFSKKGATAHAVSLMRKTVGSEMGVKASGGIRTAEDFNEMVEAGASRIGTSHGKEIVDAL